MGKIKNQDSLIQLAQNIYDGDPTGHDFGHIERVLDYCEKISAKEGGDWEIIYISALFHDIHRILQSDSGKYLTPQEAMPEVKKLFEQIEHLLPQNKIEKILYNIEHHEEKNMSIGPNNIELAILQDADNLDGLGKNGLERTQKYCKHHNIPLFDPEPLDSINYVVNVHPISTCHFVYRTMLPQYELLHTDVAKQIAKKDKKMLYGFIDKQRKKYYKNNKKAQ